MDLLKIISFSSFSFAFILSTSIAAQSLPIDFENAISTEDFIDFDGGVASVIDNPVPELDNDSSKVGQIIRTGGQIWAGSKISLAANLDFNTDNTISMKVFSRAPIGTQVKLKLEGNGEVERDAYTSMSGQWETLTWDFTGVPSNFNDIVFMFDFGNIGDGSISSTFFFDDVEQNFGGSQIDLPVDFESSSVNYTMTDFGGNVSERVVDPTASTNNVIKVIKTNGAATWAGTTIGTPSGFASDIPLSITESKMTIKVWSPRAGIPVRLKVEDHADPTHTCETQTNTTVDANWEIMEFDFLNQATGTELLSIGLERGWRYNMASIFFDFGTEGSSSTDSIYYFDEVKFGDLTSSIPFINLVKTTIYPNPTLDYWHFDTALNDVQSVEIYNSKGSLLMIHIVTNSLFRIDATTLMSGMYFAKIIGKDGYTIQRILKIE